jgi:ABC-2 type transport system permease protein
MKNTLRQPVWVFMGFATPLLYMFLFAPLLIGLADPQPTLAQVFNSFVPGLLTMLAFSAGIGSGWDIIEDLKAGIIERFRVTSARRFSIMFCSVLHDVTIFLVPASAVLIIALCFGFTINILGLVVLLLLLCMLTCLVSAFSASTALKLKEMGSFSALAMGLQLPLMLLSGILLPISSGPQWLQILAYFNPLYYTVDASRHLAEGTILSVPVYIAFAIIVPLTAFMLWLASRVYKKAVK